MNKWVQSLCCVCGLKREDEAQSAVNVTDDYRYSPQPNGGRTIYNAPTTSGTSENNNGHYYESQYNRSPKQPLTTHHQKQASTSSSESSGPYIPISECHSGNPNEKSRTDGKKPLNKNVIRADELYDFPRSTGYNKEGQMVLTCNHASPIDPELDAHHHHWPNFSSSKDDIIRASVRSCSALLDSSKSNSTLTRDNRNSQSFHSASRLRGAPAESSSSQASKKDCTPPPRPPKPPTLRKSKSNETLDDLQQTVPPPPPVVTVSSVDEYDIPKSSFNNINQVVPTPMVAVYVRSTKPPQTNASELYDFPKSIESTEVVQNKSEPVIDLNAPVPVSTMKKEGGKHAYSNAAPGFMATNESVFNYDYKPTLPTTSDDQLVADGMSHPSTTDKSPRTPNSVFTPSSDNTPPAVDRKLKPRRKGSDSDATASPTTPHPFPLSPPPAVVRNSNFSTSTLPSSKSFKNKNG